jgi:hypothetical protein
MGKLMASMKVLTSKSALTGLAATSVLDKILTLQVSHKRLCWDLHVKLAAAFAKPITALQYLPNLCPLHT